MIHSMTSLRSVTKIATCSLFAVCSLLSSARAATVTDLVETPTSLSFNFSGTGYFDWIYLAVPALTYWEINQESHDVNSTQGTYNAFLFFKVPGENQPFLDYAGPQVAFGSTLTDTRNFALTSHVFTITVNPTTDNEWGGYRGSYSAQVTGSSVADTGRSILLLALGLTGLAAIRRAGYSLTGRGTRWFKE
jgi:hypothetical protein